MSTRAAAFSIASLLGLPSSAISEQERTAVCTARAIVDGDHQDMDEEIDVGGVEGYQQPASGRDSGDLSMIE